MDQPTAALIADMKQRGLLKRTLVVWATEFGRMPFLQSNGTGRVHNPGAFTCFLTGAGVKRVSATVKATSPDSKLRSTRQPFTTSTQRCCI